MKCFYLSLFILVVFAFLVSCVLFTSALICSDTDNGADKYNMGVVTSVSGNKWADNCVQGTKNGLIGCSGADCGVNEMSCNPINGGLQIDGIYYRKLSCESGCSNGACIDPNFRGPRNYNAVQWIRENNYTVARVVGNVKGNYGNVLRYNKIMDAVDSARSNEFIIVGDGEYDENINVNKKISLIAENQGMAKIYGHNIFAGNYIKGFFISQKSWPTLVNKGVEACPGGKTCYNVCPNACAGQAEIEGLRVESGIAEDITAYRTDGSGIGLRGNNVIVRNSLMKENRRNGYVGGQTCQTCPILNNMEFSNNILADNNKPVYNGTYSLNSGYEAGGGKFLGTDGLIVRNNEAYGNVGKGIWLDYTNINYEVSYNYVYNNHVGIATELNGYNNTGKSKIHHNTIGNHSIVLDGEGMGIWETMNVDVTDNLFLAYSPGGAMKIRHQRGRGPYYIYNITIKNNRFFNGADISVGNDLTDPEIIKGIYGAGTCSFTGQYIWTNKAYLEGCNINRCVQNNSGWGWNAC